MNQLGQLEMEALNLWNFSFEKEGQEWNVQDVKFYEAGYSTLENARTNKKNSVTIDSYSIIRLLEITCNGDRFESNLTTLRSLIILDECIGRWKKQEWKKSLDLFMGDTDEVNMKLFGLMIRQGRVSLIHLSVC